MSKVRTFLVLGLIVGSMTLAGCCGFDPCDPFPDPCCDDPCAAPADAAPAKEAAPAADAKGGKGCGGDKG